MSKPAKIILFVATLWPLIYMFIFFGFIFSGVSSLAGLLNTSGGPPTGFMTIFGLHLITVTWMMGLIVIYIINVFNNERVAGDKKALWAVVLFLGSIISMPVYWYLYIWKEPDQTGYEI